MTLAVKHYHDFIEIYFKFTEKMFLEFLQWVHSIRTDKWIQKYTEWTQPQIEIQNASTIELKEHFSIRWSQESKIYYLAYFQKTCSDAQHQLIPSSSFFSGSLRSTEMSSWNTNLWILNIGPRLQSIITLFQEIHPWWAYDCKIIVDCCLFVFRHFRLVAIPRCNCDAESIRTKTKRHWRKLKPWEF